MMHLPALKYVHGQASHHTCVQVPGLTGPATGVCGPASLPYGSAGTGLRLQSFVMPLPIQSAASYSPCKPAFTDVYTYTLGVEQQAQYLLPNPGDKSCLTAARPCRG